MSTIILTLNSNFTDPSDLDKKVKNVFKMFKKYLKNTSSPISKESDMESLYEYNNLTPDNVRITKRTAKKNARLAVQAKRKERELKRLEKKKQKDLEKKKKKDLEKKKKIDKIKKDAEIKIKKLISQVPELEEGEIRS